MAINSLEEQIAIIDHAGTIVDVNLAWTNFGTENGLSPNYASVGNNYLKVVSASAASGDSFANEVVQGMLDVLSGQCTSYCFEYPCHSPHEKRWFIMHITRLKDDARILYVISHQNITQRRSAEQKIQELNGVLEQRVQDRTWQLENINEKLKKEITERQRAEEETLQLLQQNRKLTQRIFKAQEDERRYLARELHDEFGQQLAAIHLNAETIKILSKKQHMKIHESAEIIDEIAIDMQKNIRGMLRQLRPTLLNEMGLKDSLKELVQQWQIRFPKIDIKFSMKGELNDFEDNLNISIYRIIQESLTNVAKHADAHNVSVQLIRQPGEIEAQDSLLLTVKDNGKGLNDTFIAERTELPGLRERVLAVGGKFAIKSIKGKGVHIEARIPINVN